MKFKLYVALLACLPLLAFSAESASEAESVSIRFSVVGWADEIEGLFYKDDGELKELAFRPFQRSSEFYTYTGAPILEIFSKEKVEGEEAQYLPVTSVNLPLSSRNLNILIFPAGSGKYRALAISENINDFPGGHAKIFNATSTTLAVRFNGSEVKEVAKGKSLLMKPEKGVLDYEILYQSGERWLMASRNKVRCRENVQFSIFVSATDADFFRSATGARKSKVNTFFLHREVE